MVHIKRDFRKKSLIGNFTTEMTFHFIDHIQTFSDIEKCLKTHCTQPRHCVLSIGQEGPSQVEAVSPGVRDSLPLLFL